MRLSGIFSPSVSSAYLGPELEVELVQVGVHELEDQEELVFDLQHLQQFHHVGVLQLLQTLHFLQLRALGS